MRSSAFIVRRIHLHFDYRHQSHRSVWCQLIFPSAARGGRFVLFPIPPISLGKGRHVTGRGMTYSLLFSNLCPCSESSLCDSILFPPPFLLCDWIQTQAGSRDRFLSILATIKTCSSLTMSMALSSTYMSGGSAPTSSSNYVVVFVSTATTRGLVLWIRISVAGMRWVWISSKWECMVLILRLLLLLMLREGLEVVLTRPGNGRHMSMCMY